MNKNLKRNKTKKIKKLFATFLLIPTLLIPSFVSAAPSLTKLKVNNIKIAEKQNTLNKKIEEAQEIKSKKNIESQDKNPIFSPWAAEELNQAQFMGLYPAKNFFDGRDFTKAATLDDAKTCYKLAKEKIEAKGLETGGDFSFKNLSRAEILNSISKLLGDEKFEIKNLRAAKIFLGPADEKYLNSKIPLQEMISLYSRAVNKVLQDKGKVSKGFFYEVNNKGNKIYMLGSIHVGNSSLYPIDENIIKALKSSEKIYMEIDLSNREEAKKMRQKIYYSDGKNLKDDLGEELYSRVLKIFQGYGMEEDQVKILRPWAIYNTMASDPKGESPKGSFGVESYFLALSLLNKIEIDELESMEFQSNILSNFDKKTYVEMIENLTAEIEKNGYKNINSGLYTLLDAWQSGDRDKMKSILSLKGDKASEKFNEAILDERDEGMAKKIDAMLKKDGKNTYFILIGSAHLVPENSVTGILKNMGYKVIEK
ncbi:TraB/GumN family protein [uncultured Peptoniphilus sp.]|uniref:TraB/GumN family protein n=1 Tax=uncultured Peptoniphilus sp. TaxID=254354 RepID=UPI002805F8F1|nr:TraB/GumN family protein [uncultured Peptoniphilus sp.]MDU5570052.1 TraB/GumN family protein [Peptoniphilus harei]